MQDEKYWALRDVMDKIAEKHGRATAAFLLQSFGRNETDFRTDTMHFKIAHKILNYSLYFLCKFHEFIQRCS